MSETPPVDAPETGHIDSADEPSDSQPGRHVGNDMLLSMSSFVGNHPRHRVDPEATA